MAPKVAININAENQQTLLISRITDENEHLKSLNKEKEDKIEELESIIEKQSSSISQLENQLKNQNHKDTLDKLISASISILSSFGTKEDINSIHLTSIKDAGPKMVLFHLKLLFNKNLIELIYARLCYLHIMIIKYYTA